MRAVPAGARDHRAWRRLGRRAVRAQVRELRLHLQQLAAEQPEVLDVDGSWLSGTVSLRLSGHRLVLGGVAPTTVWDLLAMAHSAAPLRLHRAGRYGPFWWIAAAGDVVQPVMATHLQLHHDPGRSQRSALGLPVLSGAR